MGIVTMFLLALVGAFLLGTGIGHSAASRYLNGDIVAMMLIGGLLLSTAMVIFFYSFPPDVIHALTLGAWK